MTDRRGTYNIDAIEHKWQKFWEENKTFKANDCDDSKPKYYILDMFPYPSGGGIHAGHVENYTASDIVAWDAFGLPAEQNAVKTGTAPKATTQKNIDNMRRQTKALGFSYDWDREVDTTDPKYYKWTQWIFLKFFNSYFDDREHKGKPIEELSIPEGLSEKETQKYIDEHRLAYEAEVPVNWCPALGTVLANEEVVGGVSERGGHPVVRKPMRQWMLRITKYAERLLEDLAEVDWPESIKKLQIDWIGKSIGAEVDFKVDGFDDVIRVFTTRPDTLFGATYMVLAPEHTLVDKITSDTKKQEVDMYRQEAARKSDLDRTDLAKEKSGVFTGAHAINPVNNEKIPIWISDYVLISYGTGAIMSVPAHDERDFEFAHKFDLPIIPVVEPPKNARILLGIPSAAKKGDGYEAHVYEMVDTADLSEEALWEAYHDQAIKGQMCYTGDGTAINSGQFDGLPTAEFKEQITSWLAGKGLGKKAVNYKLRDWLFSRQRYWGEPFPILHTKNDNVVGLSEEALPLELPEVETYKPAGTGESPLANIKAWVNVKLPDGSTATRETNTMPQWAGSCWYYLRYLDPRNSQRGWDPEKEKYWMPVDLYIGGAEHAVLHLLYARFWHKLLYDLGYVSTNEPFKKLINQGMILGEDGQKMSKSRGNVVNPDKVVADYGADSMRLYEMFMGPLEATKPWNMQGVEGVHRFLQRVWRMIIDEDGEPFATCNSDLVSGEQAHKKTLRLLHQTIKKVGEDIETLDLNTAISAMMIFVNHLSRQPDRPRSVVERFILILAPFAPHIAEELWARLGHTKSLAYEPWPEYDRELIKEEEIELAVQVNGRIRDRIVVAADASEERIQSQVLSSSKVYAAMGGKPARKIIVIKPRIVSIVT
ncbi:MAG: leucine--tRNA ligase [Planctomycetota bacterium]|jgi:leucyl-tRNA synthetase